MKITKYGHACLLLEKGNARIVVDPGDWSTIPELENIDAILITHEHFDHFDIKKITALIQKNPTLSIFCNEHVGALLAEKGIASEKLADGDSANLKGVTLAGFGTEHDIVYGPTSPCENTGYLIDAELFIPGDALSVIPPIQIRTLALPTGGPWMKFSEAIDYAKKIAPTVTFPIHDALYTEEVRREMVPRLMGGHLESAGIQFRDLRDGESIDV